MYKLLLLIFMTSLSMSGYDVDALLQESSGTKSFSDPVDISQEAKSINKNVKRNEDKLKNKQRKAMHDILKNVNKDIRASRGYGISSSGSKTFECTYRCRTDGVIGFDKSDYSTTVQANTNYQAEEIVEKRANEQCKKLHMWSTSIRCELKLL